MDTDGTEKGSCEEGKAGDRRGRLVPVRVKICGITNLSDALLSAEAGADAVGFIFYPKSPRFVTAEAVAAIVRDLPPFVTPVGVFVNEPREAISERVAACGLRVVQLHGDETPEDCAGFPVPVFRAVRVRVGFDTRSLAAYAQRGVRTFLLDTAKPGYYGGTGETFNWSIAREAKAQGRVILSGGMTPDNVEEGLRRVAPYGVDASSGVEAEPGKKDPEKVRAFVAGAKRCPRRRGAMLC